MAPGNLIQDSIEHLVHIWVTQARLSFSATRIFATGELRSLTATQCSTVHIFAHRRRKSFVLQQFAEEVDCVHKHPLNQFLEGRRFEKLCNDVSRGQL
jgi:hypothetical protein